MGQQFVITVEKLRAKDVESLRLIVIHCIQNLEHPKLREAAMATLRNAQQCYIERSIASGEFTPMFRVMGYNVRWTELSATDRRRVLWTILNEDLPPINSEAYMRKWGTPQTIERLRAIWRELQTYMRSYGHNDRKEIAVARWSKDMRFLERVAQNLNESGRVSLDDIERLAAEVPDEELLIAPVVE